MQTVLVTPVKGVRVRKADGTFLDEKGENLERTSYWLRREMDGDVTITEPRQAGKSASSK